MGSFVRAELSLRVEDHTRALRDKRDRKPSNKILSLPKISTIGVATLGLAQICNREYEDFMKLLPIKNDSGKVVGKIGVGWFPTIPRSPLEIRKQKKKWFEKKFEKESRKFEKLTGRMIDFMFGVKDTARKLRGVTQNAKGPEAEAKVMYELMRTVKHQEGREYFAAKLDPQNLPSKGASKKGPAVSIQTLRVFNIVSMLVKAALREGVSSRDFLLNKILMDLSYLYSFTDSDQQNTFMYVDIMHEASYSESMEYWESAFVSMEQIVNPPQEKKDAKNKEEKIFKKRTLTLLRNFLHQMVFFSDISVQKGLDFADKMSLLFELSPTHADLKKLIAERGKFRDFFEVKKRTRVSFTDRKSAPKMMTAKRHSIQGVRLKMEDGALKASTWVRCRTPMGIYFHNRETNEISDFPPPNAHVGDAHTVQTLPTKVHVQRTKEYLFREVKLGTIGECWKQTRVGQTKTWGQLQGKFRSVRGSMTVTNFRVEFDSFEEEEVMSEMIPVHAMERFEHDVFTVTTAIGVTQDMQVMVFHTKDFRTLRLTAPYSKQLSKLLRKIKKLAFPKDVRNLFAFIYRQPVAIVDNGWEIFSVKKEMRRQLALQSGWRITNVNKDFQFSPTYPQYMTVPNFVSDVELGLIAKFRSKKRLPILTYYLHKTNSCMLRASQPMVGLTGNRGKEEEQMFMELNITAIYDARPTENAFANKAKGGGYEDTRNYSRKGEKKCEIFFCDIHNIHRMRTSLQQVIQACEQQLSRRSDDFWDLVLKSKWLCHVRNLCVQSQRVALAMLRGENVLVHCSDGWDRTAQMCGLAQIVLDPFFRTIEGLAVLIEKDWCSFGHKFHTRIGHASSKFADSDRSPIFVQFLDALWQIWRQAPHKFEYNEYTLEFLANELVACKYGTFLFDCEKQRNEYLVRQSTVSVWTYVRTHKEKFINPLYLPAANAPIQYEKNLKKTNLKQAQQSEVLIINMDPRNFEVWPYYFRQDYHLTKSIHSAGWIGDNILALHNSKAKLQIEWLQTRIAELKAMLEENKSTRKTSIGDMKVIEERKIHPSRMKPRPSQPLCVRMASDELAGYNPRPRASANFKPPAPTDTLSEDNDRENGIPTLKAATPMEAELNPNISEDSLPKLSNASMTEVPSRPREMTGPMLMSEELKKDQKAIEDQVVQPSVRNPTNNTSRSVQPEPKEEVQVQQQPEKMEIPKTKPRVETSMPKSQSQPVQPVRQPPPPFRKRMTPSSPKTTGWNAAPPPPGHSRHTTPTSIVGSSSSIPPPPPLNRTGDVSPSRISRASTGGTTVGRVPLTPTRAAPPPFRRPNGKKKSTSALSQQIKAAAEKMQKGVRGGFNPISATSGLPNATTATGTWSEHHSVSSAMAIAPTVRTVKTAASEIEEESPRSLSPNPSQALPSHLSQSPTEMSSIMAVGERDHGWDTKERSSNSRRPPTFPKQPAPPSGSLHLTPRVHSYHSRPSTSAGVDESVKSVAGSFMRGDSTAASVHSTSVAAPTLIMPDFSAASSVDLSQREASVVTSAAVKEREQPGHDVKYTESMESLVVGEGTPMSVSKMSGFQGSVKLARKDDHKHDSRRSTVDSDNVETSQERDLDKPPPPPEDSEDENTSDDERYERKRQPESNRTSMSGTHPPAQPEATSFDWGATIKASMLTGNKKDFFVSVRRSTLQKGKTGSSSRMGGIAEGKDESGSYSAGPSLRARNFYPPPPPESDEEEEDSTE
eukprot:CAMPEP_0167743182 /NCGR_PEP_ID=MMETSP0110_2-20121227/1870_1 /TAXON_ID=629695 /ORGANISM="Gymnochlora sp., Strain CCMP2014" /LENGTH=1717 /DNA_ID=CAMNT_0007627517 /DNA_START=148 /DNA_END=5301 /DNA_ORIENTATION=-